MARIYFDHNATTPVAPEVAEVVATTTQTVFGNPSSVHRYGQQAKMVLDKARASVAKLLGAEPTEIIFTSGGSESNNLAIRGAAEAAIATGRRHLVTSSIEHEAVLRTVKALSMQGWTATLVGVDSSGIVSPERLADALRNDTALVSIMHANNEIGTIQPVAKLAALTHECGALFHTDAVQSAGKIPIDARALDVDLLSISAHKFNGPKGIGALWARRGAQLRAQLTGGKQERSRRAGTENVPAIAGLGVAAKLAVENQTVALEYLGTLRDRLEGGILANVSGAERNGEALHRVNNTCNISFDGVEAESLLIALDLEGIAVSTGSACSSGSLEPSHVLQAMGFPSHRTQNAIRFSLGLGNTEEEVDHVLAVIPAIVSRLRAVTRRGLQTTSALRR